MQEIQNEISLMVVQSTLSELPDASLRFKLEKLRRLKKKSRYMANLILDELVSMKRNLVGDSATYLIKAYLELGLLEVSVSKVNSSSWKRIAKGLRELEIMEQVNERHHMFGYLTHSNYYLRREARLSMAGLSPNPLFFLDNFKEVLSEWEKILLLQKLKRRPPEVIPDFSRWYKHPNPSVVSFAIEMTVQFSQAHNVKNLEVLLASTADHHLICMIIDVLRRMEAVQSLEVIGNILVQVNSFKITIACLKFIGAIGDDSYKSILYPFTKSKNPMVRLEAVRALYETGSTLGRSTNEEIDAMLNHIKHSLIV